MRKAGTNARNLSIAPGTYQFLWNRRVPYHISAIGAEPSVINDGLATSIAVHESALCYQDTTMTAKMFPNCRAADLKKRGSERHIISAKAGKPSIPT